MDKLTIFVIVVLLAVVRGLLQRRQVARDLEQRLAIARKRSKIRRRGGRLPSQEAEDEVSEEGEYESRGDASRGDE